MALGLSKLRDISVSPRRRVAIKIRQIAPFPAVVMQDILRRLTATRNCKEGDILAYRFDVNLDSGSVYAEGDVDVVVAFPGKVERMQAHPLKHRYESLRECAAGGLGAMGAIESNEDLARAVRDACEPFDFSRHNSIPFAAIVIREGVLLAPYPGSLEEMGYSNVEPEDLILGFRFQGQSAHSRIEFIPRMDEIAHRVIPFLRTVELAEA